MDDNWSAMAKSRLPKKKVSTLALRKKSVAKSLTSPRLTVAIAANLSSCMWLPEVRR